MQNNQKNTILSSKNSKFCNFILSFIRVFNLKQIFLNKPQIVNIGDYVLNVENDVNKAFESLKDEYTRK